MMTDANMRDTFLDTIDAALDGDQRLAVVLADISAAQLEPARSRHPERVINVGIREQLLISLAGGLALSGMRPVVHTFAPFVVDRPYEQLKLDLAHQGVGAVLVSYGASYDMPQAGRTHQSPADIALIDTLPGWTVHVPGHPDEARRLLLDALPGDDSVYLRLSAASNGRPQGGDGMRVLRHGRDGVVLAVGPMLDRTLEAVRDLDVTVLYTNTIRPLDTVGLRAAAQAATADVLLVEPYLAGTSAHLVNDALGDVPHRLRSLGVGREPELRRYGQMSDHDSGHGLHSPGIAASAREFFARTLSPA